MTIAEIRRVARGNLGRRVIVELKSGRDVEGVIVFAGIFSLILRTRVRGRIVFRRIFYRNIIRIVPIVF
ncbi:acetyl-CoA acetyltransferase [Paenibacillus sp.]|jgi:hypothetical protein|uniref:acetyl-CoA acetyltransferase n=1 Tax=Paenibacillus sp. TaxID=58172 RepID=UPI00282F36DF|nr:acetyl-CoA acetyltransferase [Paenibacillus sp.]MDR0267961.1 acetyl-CoA acetyltransferase [Paenibacillus sp.]